MSTLWHFLTATQEGLNSTSPDLRPKMSTFRPPTHLYYPPILLRSLYTYFSLLPDLYNFPTLYFFKYLDLVCTFRHNTKD